MVSTVDISDNMNESSIFLSLESMEFSLRRLRKSNKYLTKHALEHVIWLTRKQISNEARKLTGMTQADRSNAWILSLKVFPIRSNSYERIIDGTVLWQVRAGLTYNGIEFRAEWKKFADLKVVLLCQQGGKTCNTIAAFSICLKQFKHSKFPMHLRAWRRWA